MAMMNQSQPPRRTMKRFHGCSSMEWSVLMLFGPRSYNFTRFNLNELLITETELKLIAAAAIIGDNSMPKNG